MLSILGKHKMSLVRDFGVFNSESHSSLIQGAVLRELIRVGDPKLVGWCPCCLLIVGAFFFCHISRTILLKMYESQ